MLSAFMIWCTLDYSLHLPLPTQHALDPHALCYSVAYLHLAYADTAYSHSTGSVRP